MRVGSIAAYRSTTGTKCRNDGASQPDADADAAVAVAAIVL
jgi:hypothetical protein